jgi:hypothetical protein
MKPKAAALRSSYFERRRRRDSLAEGLQNALRALGGAPFEHHSRTLIRIAALYLWGAITEDHAQQDARSAHPDILERATFQIRDWIRHVNQ